MLVIRNDFRFSICESKLQISYVWTISLEPNCIIRLYKACNFSWLSASMLNCSSESPCYVAGITSQHEMPCRLNGSLGWLLAVPQLPATYGRRQNTIIINFIWFAILFDNLNKLFTFISLDCFYFCVFMKQEINELHVWMFVPFVLCSLSCAVCLVQFVIQTSKYTLCVYKMEDLRYIKYW